MNETLKNNLLFVGILILAAMLMALGEYLGIRSTDAVGYFTGVL
ncbi:MAG: hypothetical protein WCT49_02895 [Candidatus Paceibacterota bacterium]|jgi:hypothetical protein